MQIGQCRTLDELRVEIELRVAIAQPEEKRRREAVTSLAARQETVGPGIGRGKRGLLLADVGRLAMGFKNETLVPGVRERRQQGGQAVRNCHAESSWDVGHPMRSNTAAKKPSVPWRSGQSRKYCPVSMPMRCAASSSLHGIGRKSGCRSANCTATASFSSRRMLQVA